MSRRCWLVPAVVFLVGCGGQEPSTVVLYVSADEHIARQVIGQFEKQTGVQVLMVGDTEAKKSTGLVDRLRSEMDRPQADVFWSSEIFMTIDLAEDGVLGEFKSDSTAGWPDRYRDPQHRWCGFAARARVIVYAPDRVPEAEAPQTWMALRDQRFRDRIAMADPRFGTTGGHLGAMKAYWDQHIMPGYYAAFIEALAANNARLLPSGNAGVVEAVASGEADVGLTDSDDVWAAQARGLNVRLVYPAHDVDASGQGGGTLLIPNTVALVKGGPHPEQARRLIEFLLSEQVERMLAESVSHNIPLRPGLAQRYSDYVVPDPLVVDYRAAAKARPAAIKAAMHWLDPRSRSEPLAPEEDANHAR
ncbi:MAG: extracellular solute-binding protein [Phycisphaerales bacterium]|nr:extracellular solute-binding protein [Phycisphaerales bacterium]MCI0629144.1 extracellular solute-binding protein [Phycisphaerales bacterium]